MDLNNCLLIRLVDKLRYDHALVMLRALLRTPDRHRQLRGFLMALSHTEEELEKAINTYMNEGWPETTYEDVVNSYQCVCQE